MTDWIGQQLGNYRIVRLLGRGGFAEVYLGEHVYLKSLAALKVLHTSLQDQDVQRFLSEAQTLVRLRHPYIVRVLEFAIEQGAPVLIMDYAPWGTVRQQYPRGSRLPFATAVTYVKQVAAALQYAHNSNVIHRDVKPENLLLDEHQNLLLSDFGLAVLSPSPDLLSTQEMAGTIRYMAPEQIRGKPSFASDQQALQATYSAATASADANATATAQLNATATLTENPYDANLKTLVLNETLNRNSASRWDETSGSCSFTSEGYHVTDLAQATTPQRCSQYRLQ